MTRRQVIALFVVAWIVYCAFGLYLTIGQQVFIGDALSRVQSAQAVLFSRDPHLAAIGFIFTPLTTVAQLPLVAFAPWWQPMTADAVSGVIMSSAFMAGSVVQLSGIARDRGVPYWLGVSVTVCYVVNPMILFYGANGMSEAPYIFFLVWAIRRLIRWVDTDDVHELVVAGVALALAYLTRYDGTAAAFAAGIFVAVVSYRRRDPRRRVQRAIMDMFIVAAPSATAFLLWAFTSWLISGNFFAQFASEYGNSSIVEQSGGSGSDTAARALGFSLTELALLPPLLPIVLVMVFLVRFRRRRLYPLMAAVAVIGAVLLFQTISYARGSTFGFLRFYITVIPLAAIVALLSVPSTRPVPFRRPGRHADPRPVSRWAQYPVWYSVVGVVAALSMVVAISSATWGMTSPKYAPQEYELTAVVVPRPDSTDQTYLDASRVARSFSTERALSEYLDSLGLPDGSILCDTVYGFAVVVRSARPKQYVIPSDQDFTNILNDPAANGVQYMLAVPNEGRGVSDALNTRFPTLYENGAGIGSLVLEARNQGADLPKWRLYRVIR
ncbi:glycosyltransferase family 39 protein [Gordonia sp. NPDC003424]